MSTKSSQPPTTIPLTYIKQQVSQALAEDVGPGDLTASLLNEATITRARVISRQPGIICGTVWFEEVFRQLDPEINIKWHLIDGHPVTSGQAICELEGHARGLLTGERTALNFLQTLSGVATKANTFANAVKGTGARVLDTRKTIPGLRLALKYAVKCGGCHNHRVGLYDAILIKENHIHAAGSITDAIKAAISQSSNQVDIEIEVENLSDLKEAVSAGAHHVLLDNFAPDDLVRAVELCQGKVRLEASGAVNLNSIRQIAETGVDDISVGLLTKDIEALDLSMRYLA